jgi:hypothetical protein
MGYGDAQNVSELSDKNVPKRCDFFRLDESDQGWPRRRDLSEHATEEERMKISCSEVRRELANYMEDDVDVELRSRIEQHFLECDGCNALYDSIRKIVRLVGSTEIIDLPAGFSRRLYERLSAIPS